MKLSMNLSFLALVSLLASCQHKEVTPIVSHDIEIQISEPESSIEMTGKNYFIYWNDQDNLFPSRIRNRVVSKIQKEMQSKGYKEVNLLRKSHVTVFLNSSKSGVEEPGTETVSTTQTLVVVDGKKQFKTRTVKGIPVQFQISISTNTFGQRFKYVASFSYISNKKDWYGLEENLAKLVEQTSFDSVPKAPLTNKKMGGDPGCQPRLGYEENLNGVITQIYKNSPAEDAGLKVGDQLLSIDSENYRDAVKKEEIYKPNLKVPLKFLRDQKIIRSNIQARIMCE